jgi:hypothetical protein
MQEETPETIENTESFDSESVERGTKSGADEVRRAIS